MTKIRLFCIGHEVHFGGGIKIQMSLLQNIDPEQFDVEICFLRNKGKWHQSESDPFPVNFLLNENESIKTHAVSVLFRLWKRAKQSDVIFAIGEGTPMYLGALIAAMSSKPAVGWVHVRWSEIVKHWYRPWHIPLSRWAYPWLDQIICVTNQVREDLVNFNERLRDKAVFIPNPLDISKVQEESLAPLPQWADLIFQKKTILAVGSLSAVKGFDLLIEAFSHLIEKGHEFNLLILGEGPQRPQLEAQIDELGLSNSVFLPGLQTNPYPFFRQASLFCMSSQSEGLGMVLLEAMCLKLPIIALDIPATQEILQGGQYGKIVYSRDPLELAKEITMLLDSQTQTDELQNKAFNSTAVFALQKVTKKFENLFRTITS